MSLNKNIADYYDSHEANAFYQKIWGDGIHIGIYRPKSLSIEEACQKTTERMLRYSPKLSKSSKVLVIGSGLGGPARFLAEKFGCKVECLHFSEAQNQYHKKKVDEMGLDKVSIIKGRFDSLPFDRDSFDLVWSQDMLLHAEKKIRTLREVNRVLKPKGRFVCSDIVKSEDCPDEVLPKLLERLYLKQLVSSEQYQRLAKRVGLLKIYAIGMPDQIGIHFQKLSERIEEVKPKGNQTTLEKMKKVIRDWANATEEGHLEWAIFIFQKINI